MKRDPSSVLSDLITRQALASFTLAQRQNAVAALGELEGPEPIARLSEIADDRELQQEVRDSALETLLKAHPDQLATWLNKAGGDNQVKRWGRLAKLKWKGSKLDLSAVGWFKRLGLAAQLRTEEAASWRPSVAGAVTLALVGVVIMLTALGPLGAASIDVADLADAFGPPLLLTVLFVLLLGFFARPVTSSPDPWVFIAPELATTMIVSGLGLVAGGIVLGELSELQGQIGRFALVGAAVAGLLRLASALSHDMLRGTRRWGLAIFFGAAAAVGLLLIGSFLSNEPKEFHLYICLAAAQPALALLFWQFDRVPIDSVTTEGKRLRLLCLAPIALAAVLASIAYAWKVAGAPGIEVAKSVTVDGPGQMELFLPLDDELEIYSPWTQTLTAVAEWNSDIVFYLDTEEAPQDDDEPNLSSETRTFAIDAGGRRELRISARSGSRADGEEAGFDSVLVSALSRLGGTTAETELRGRFVRLTLEGDVTEDEIELIRGFPGDLLALAYVESGFGLITRDFVGSRRSGESEKGLGRIAAGSLIYRDPEDFSVRPVAGRFSGTLRPEPPLIKGTHWLGDRPPEGQVLAQAMTFARRKGTSESGRFTKPFGADYGHSTLRLSLLRDPKVEEGALGVTLTSLLGQQRGGLFRVLGHEGTNELKVEPLKVWLRPDETPAACYILPESMVWFAAPLSRQDYENVLTEVRKVDGLEPPKSIADPSPGAAPDQCVRMASQPGSLYLSLDGDSEGLIWLNTETEEAVRLGKTGVEGPTVGLTYDPTTERLLGSEWSELLEIMPSGEGFRALGGPGTEGLAYDPIDGVVYGAINGDFFTLDRNSGEKIETLPESRTDFEGLAIDPATRMVYALGENKLGVYDIEAGSWGEYITLENSWEAAGLTFDESTGDLYGFGNLKSPRTLYRINPATGDTKPVAEFEIELRGGLALGPPIQR